MVKILQIEDNDIQRTTRSAILRYKGFEVLEAADRQTAEPLLKEHPDVVLMDYFFPGEQGESVDAIRAEYPEIPLIVLSGYSLAEEDVVAKGAIFLLKPAAPDAIVEAIHQALGRAA